MFRQTVMAKFAVQVTVNCEACHNDFTYEHIFQAAGSGVFRSEAEIVALQNRGNLIEKVTRDIEAGNLSSVTDYKPCPKCGYVQSWMEKIIRRRRGWQLGIGTGFTAYMVMFVVLAALEMKSPDIIQTTPDSIAGLLACAAAVLPIILIFIVCSIFIKTFNPNKKHKTSFEAKKPSVSFL